MAANDYESRELKKSLGKMRPLEKLQYFFSYYTIHFLLAVLAVAIVVSVIVRIATKKETVLYIAFTNAAIGSVLENELTDAFLADAGFDARKNEIELYKELYISNDPAQENHEYAYASGLKVMASINAGKLDLVIMNRESYDVFSGNGYLADLSALTEGALGEKLAPYLVQNDIILTDNSLEVALGEAEETEIVTETALNAVNVTSLPVFREAGFQADVYLGVIANSERTETAVRYLEYLLG